MKNLHPLIVQALRVRLALQPQRTVSEALLPYRPVGWSAAVSLPGTDTASYWGGDACVGEAAAGRDTIFRIASVSKVIGAAAALTLVRAGQLALDAPIAEYLGFAVRKPITLRQLLTHTAALDDTAAYNRAVAASPLPPLQAVLDSSFLPYAPGTRFRYSNLGAGIAGMLVEAVSGMPFDDYVRKTLFAPYGIDASFHPQNIRHKERMANCYRPSDTSPSYDAKAIAAMPLDDFADPSRHYQVPAGKLMISAPDLLDTLLRLRREFPEMFARQSVVGSVAADSGRGLGTAYAPKGVLSARQALWGHQGVAYGALCEAWLDPQDGGAAAVLLINGVNLASIGPLYLAGQSGVHALLDR